MGDLRVGLNIDIQRTNGRIHSAVISNIDWIGRSVTVEWSEANEIKGKEIDFDSLFQLNPSITNALSNTGPGTVPNSRKTLAIQPPRPSNARSAGDPSKESLRVKAKSRVTGIGTINGNSNGVVLEQINPNVMTNNPPTFSSTQGNNHSTATQLLTSSTNNNIASTQRSNVPTIAAANKAEARRKSNVVKEVDKIKKQREERRARQEKERQEKNELIASVEPGNPNWEFLGMIREYKSQLEFRPITANDAVNDHQICVAVRKRPMNKREASRKDIDVITVPSKDLIIVHEPKVKVDLKRYLENQMFRFDYAFDESADNELVYKFTAKPLVQTIFDGGMATCFAYGQTGSGKTHTMGGDFNGKTQESGKGIYALAAKDVFRLLKSARYRGEDLIVTASFFEIYSGKVFDLLNNKTKLRVLEDARNQVQVVGLQERQVECVDDVLKLIQMGNSVRTSGVTSANNHSSRSHAVFQIILKKRSTGKLHGKFSLIDLAGNERGADTSSADRVTRMEGAEINKSLLALKECIRALGRKGAHLPFRQSKLTQVLRDSFIGENTRTCMIAMISPGMQSCEHSLNTLRYADRVKELGAEGPDFKNQDGDEDMSANGSGDDMAVMQDNPGEYSHESYTDCISHLQEMEDEVHDLHKTVLDSFPNWMQDHSALLQMTCQVDYDVEGYAQQLENILNDNIQTLDNLRQRVGTFRSQLAQEELMSKKIVK